MRVLVHGLGYTGLTLLLLAYLLFVTRGEFWFVVVNLFASGLLTVYALLRRDWVFVFVNGFVTTVLAHKLLQLI